MITVENISKQAGIYKITNTINNKIYIGRSINLRKRIRSHLNDCRNEKYNSYFYNSIRKNGIENFEIEILFQGNFTEIELNEMEINLIKLFKSNNKIFGYNLTKGGEGVIGYEYTEEDKQKRRGVLKSKETKERMSKSRTGVKRSEEAKQKLRKPKSKKTKRGKQSDKLIEKRMKTKKLNNARRLIQENCLYEECFYSDFVYIS